MFHLSAFAATTAGAETNTALPFVTDQVLQSRNSQLIVSEPYNVIAALQVGATASRARFGNPSMIVNGIPHIFPPEVSATIPDLPQVMDFRDMPLALPLDEGVIIEHTNGAADQDTVLVWLATPDHQFDSPPGNPTFVVRGTVVIAAGSENTWGNAVAVTLERDLMKGVYAVYGAWLVAANAIAFRVSFPKARLYAGRKLEPGFAVTNAINLSPWPVQNGGMGELGRFETYELPSIRVLSDAAGGTYEVRLLVSYLGSSRSLLDQ